MNKPITSYIKGAPSFNGIPVKQTVNPGAGDVKSTEESKTEKKKVKKTVKGKEIKKTRTYEDMREAGATEAEIQAAKDANMKNFGTHNPTAEGLADNTVGTGEFEPDKEVEEEIEVTTPGSQGDIYVATEGRGLKPWQQRQINRSTKINTRERRQAKNKRDRIERRMEGLDPTSKKYKRLANKLESANSRVDAFEAGVQNNLTFRKSGRGQGENYYKGDQKMNPGQVSQNQASFDAQAKLNAEKAAYEADLAKQNKANQTVTSNSVGQAQGAVKIEPAKVNPFAEATQNLEKLKKDMASVGTYTVPTSGLFAKRGALKKSYFKNK